MHTHTHTQVRTRAHTHKQTHRYTRTHRYTKIHSEVDKYCTHVRMIHTDTRTKWWHSLKIMPGVGMIYIMLFLSYHRRVGSYSGRWPRRWCCPSRARRTTPGSWGWRRRECGRPTNSRLRKDVVSCACFMRHFFFFLTYLIRVLIQFLFHFIFVSLCCFYLFVEVCFILFSFFLGLFHFCVFFCASFCFILFRVVSFCFSLLVFVHYFVHFICSFFYSLFFIFPSSSSMSSLIFLTFPLYFFIFISIFMLLFRFYYLIYPFLFEFCFFDSLSFFHFFMDFSFVS